MKRPVPLKLIIALIFFQTANILIPQAKAQETFCNPLNLNYRFMVDALDAREAADAVIVLFKDEYYLFASRSGGYWISPDLNQWTLIIPEGLDIEGYAPAIVAMRDSLFFMTGSGGQIYKSGNPESGKWEKGPVARGYGDPAFFLDDDGRLYMSFGVSNEKPISVVELDPYTFKEIGSQVDVIYAQASIHGWERRGDDNLMDEQPWIEGSWMIKDNGKYYLHYAGPGTEFKTYGDGIYVADSPLGPYEYADYSPFAFKPTGFITGAGHGNTFKDKDGNYWHIGTMTISVQHMFERRLGLAPVAFDEDGQIRCNTDWGDYPQYLPGVKNPPIDSGFAGRMLLSHKKLVMASSSLEDHRVEYAVDEEVRTYWGAQTGGPDEWLIIDLGKECSVEAIQVNFAEHNTDPALVRGRDKDIYEQYIIESSQDGLDWDTLIDKSQNLKDVPHDYLELEEPVTTRYIKLQNVYTPGEGNFAVRDLRIFGNSDQAVFTQVNDFTVERDTSDGRDALLRWDPVEHADGYIIRYGIAPDKLYNNYMVYDADSLAIHSLNHGVDYYFSIEAFDSGTEYYSHAGEFRTHQSGNWTDVNTWSVFDGTEWIYPAPAIPSDSDGPVTLLEGHTITVSENDTVNRLTVADSAILVIEKGVTLTVKDNIGTDLVVEGTLKNLGSIVTDSTATITFSGNGLYEHGQDGGSIPKATWKPSSTCLLDSLRSQAPDNANQNFYNVIWDCPFQTTDLSLGWELITIGGNITVRNTGSGQWQMCNPGGYDLVGFDISGDILQSGGEFTVTGSEDHNHIGINQQGDIRVTGGDFSITRGTQGGTGSTIWVLLGNVSMENATTQNANPEGAKFVFSNEGTPQMLTLDGMTYGSGGFPVEVDSGTILDMGTSTLQGEGSFLLNPGATLMTAHEGGINGSVAVSGNMTLAEETSYIFNGSSPQVTGNLLPDQVKSLTVNNSNGVSLGKDVTLTGMLDVVEGSLSSGGFALAYGPGGTLRYSGNSQQITTDVEFPVNAGPASLVINNLNSVLLHDSRFVHFLDIRRKLYLGSNTLTIDTVSEAATTAFVVTTEGGFLKQPSVGGSQAFFPVGVNSYTPVWIKNSGSEDALSVGAITDSLSTSDGNTVRVIWNISEDTPGGGNYTIQFGWSSGREGSGFKHDRENLAKIYLLTDTTEAGTGDYTMQFLSIPYTLSRGGITELGPFGIGDFSESTGIDESTEHAISRCELLPNYPNPFSNETTVRFSIPERSFVNLKVHSLLGEEVAELAGKYYPSGMHTETFDGSKLTGSIYLLVFRVDDQVQTSKLVLIK